jgi:hypothetical protein
MVQAHLRERVQKWGRQGEYIASVFDLVKEPSVLVVPACIRRPKRAKVWCSYTRDKVGETFKEERTVVRKIKEITHSNIDEREAAGVPAYPDGNPAPPHVQVGTDGRFLDQARWHTLFQTQGDADDRGVRDRVADMMQDLNLHRPAHNLQRNANR